MKYCRTLRHLNIEYKIKPHDYLMIQGVNYTRFNVMHSLPHSLCLSVCLSMGLCLSLCACLLPHPHSHKCMLWLVIFMSKCQNSWHNWCKEVRFILGHRVTGNRHRGRGNMSTASVDLRTESLHGACSHVGESGSEPVTLHPQWPPSARGQSQRFQNLPRQRVNTTEPVGKSHIQTLTILNQASKKYFLNRV